MSTERLHILKQTCSFKVWLACATFLWTPGTKRLTPRTQIFSDMVTVQGRCIHCTSYPLPVYQLKYLVWSWNLQLWNSLTRSAKRCYQTGHFPKIISLDVCKNEKWHHQPTPKSRRLIFEKWKFIALLQVQKLRNMVKAQNYWSAKSNLDLSN